MGSALILKKEVDFMESETDFILKRKLIWVRNLFHSEKGVHFVVSHFILKRAF